MFQTARYCAIIIGVLQLLLALLSLWILVDLHIMGTPVNPSAFALSGSFLTVQFCILVLAFGLGPESSRRSWTLIAVYSLGLFFLAALVAITDLLNRTIDFKYVILQPGAVLPPNEIMGSGWPIGLAVMSAATAILVGILPLLGLSAVLVWRKKMSARMSSPKP